MKRKSAKATADGNDPRERAVGFLTSLFQRADVQYLCYEAQFARIYNQATYDMLIGGPFVLTWFQIAQNLTVEPHLLIEIYRNSKNKHEFNVKIMAIKRLKKQGLQA